MRKGFRKTGKDKPEWICDICGHEWKSKNGRNCFICGKGSKIKYGGKLDWRRARRRSPHE